MADATAIEGVLERITYANEATAWSVVKLAVPGRRALVTAVGPLLGARPGESLRLTGRWVVDKRWGEQFAADGWTVVAPATAVGIERYLASGLVRGVGPVMAERLVRHFGLETLAVLDAAPARLLEVPGIGPVRSRQIRAAWAEQRALKEMMIFLQAHGVSTAHAARIYRTYGERAIAVVREHPHRLVLDVPGIGFKTADQIAARLGVEPTSPRRAEAGVLHVLETLADEGHVLARRARLVERGTALLGVDAALVEAAIAAVAAAGHVVVEADPSAGAGRAAPRGGDPAGTGDSARTGGAAGTGGATGTGGAEVGGEAVYLARLHAAEVGAAERLGVLLATPAPPLTVDLAGAVAAHETGLAPGQRAALRAVLGGKVAVLTGGPGTGKTTLVNTLLDVLAGSGARVHLCAPTGRAAKRLAEATGREARTIHRLLELSPQAGTFERNRLRPLAADLVVVDEVSMVDTVLFRHLLDALPPTCRLLLVGDGDQLPSVGPGSVLRDVIRSGAVAVVRLTEIFRQAERSRIVVNAHRVNRGEPLLLEPAAGEPDPDFYFVEREEPDAILAAVKQLVAERIPRRFGLDPIDGVQVLAPMHRGLLGAANLNAELQALLNPEGAALTRGGRTLRVGDKVMQLRNDYGRDVYNGDIGRVAAVDAEERTLAVRFDGRLVRYDDADLGELVLAYACSIHKAQGSEYPGVVIPLHTQHYVMLQRNLLYTGITRGRRLVVLAGSRRALAIAIANRRTDDRATALAERLAAAARRLTGGGAP